MPCYQSTSLPSGVTAAGRTSYKTEAECLQACKEGACCEGTTCSIKPQCQCQGAGKTFKGVGTTCEPNPCPCCNQDGTPKVGSDCAWCWCFCGEGKAAYPRFINVSLSGTYRLKRQTGGGSVTKQLSASVTLSRVSDAGRSSCPAWKYGQIPGIDNGVPNNAATGQLLPIGDGAGAVHLYPRVQSTPTLVRFFFELWFEDFADQNADPFARWFFYPCYFDFSPVDPSVGIQDSGVCFAEDLAGATMPLEKPPGVDACSFPVVPGQSNFSGSAVINGAQA